MKLHVAVTHNVAEYAAKGGYSTTQWDAMNLHRRENAILTDEHATSSYGVPVLVVDGQAYGPADSCFRGLSMVIRTPMACPPPNANSESVAFLDRARRAGYNIQDDQI